VTGKRKAIDVSWAPLLKGGKMNLKSTHKQNPTNQVQTSHLHTLHNFHHWAIYHHMI